jgi:mersacidin/lichenicidin family type 2 lantibiotic
LDTIDQQLYYHQQKKGKFHMSNIVRAWKDETYRQSLSAQEQAVLPVNPAGASELTDAQLVAVYGGYGDEEQPTNDIDQDVDQKAVTTYGNEGVEYSAVWCKADNDANLHAKIKPFGEN